MSNRLRDIKDCSLDELRALLSEWGEAPFRAKQIFTWLYKRNAYTFEAMSDLSVGLREKLSAHFSFGGMRIAAIETARDGTRKLLLELEDTLCVEAVLIPAEERVTGCVSTQAGCAFGCSFCASGKRGLKRNLTCGEIITEALLLKAQASGGKLTHLVFMGTGEPFDNYDAVMKAVRIINSPEALEIGARRITISTCGIVPGIRRLAEEGLQVELSVSLHAADDATRTRLMPVNRKYPLEELIAACAAYYQQTNRQVTFEYVMIKGVNSSLQNAHKLATLLQGFDAKVNLIPANPLKEFGVESPEKLEVVLFTQRLKKLGLPVTLRKARGQDIAAACGQLRLRYEKK